MSRGAAGGEVVEFAVVVRASGHTGATELGIHGVLTHATATTVDDYLWEHLDEALSGAPRLLLDLSRCTDIDLDGLLALAAAQHAVVVRGGDLYLVRVPPLVDRYIRQHNFDHLLTDPAGVSSSP